MTDLVEAWDKETANELDDITIGVVNRLFATFREILPAFHKAWPTQKDYEGAKRQWVIAFVQAEMRDVERIKVGIKKLRLHPTPFVPSPGQFIEMCRPSPEDYGLVDARTAFVEACRESHPSSNSEWSHVTIKAAASATGNFNLTNWPERKVFPIFERYYDVAVRDFLEGKLKDIPRALTEDTEERPTDKAIGAAHLTRIKAMLKG